MHSAGYYFISFNFRQCKWIQLVGRPDTTHRRSAPKQFSITTNDFSELKSYQPDALQSSTLTRQTSLNLSLRISSVLPSGNGILALLMSWKPSLFPQSLILARILMLCTSHCLITCGFETNFSRLIFWQAFLRPTGQSYDCLNLIVIVVA